MRSREPLQFIVPDLKEGLGHVPNVCWDMLASRCFEVQTTKALFKVRRFEMALITFLCSADMKGMHPQLMHAKQGNLVGRRNTQAFGMMVLILHTSAALFWRTSKGTMRIPFTMVWSNGFENAFNVADNDFEHFNPRAPTYRVCTERLFFCT